MYITRARHPMDPLGKLYGDNHRPLPPFYSFEPEKVVALNIDTQEVLATGEYRVVWAKACETVSPDKIVIGPIDYDYTYECFAPDMVKSLKTLAQGMIPLETPSSLYEFGEALSPDLRPHKSQDGGKAGPKPKKPVGPAPVRPKQGSKTGRVWEICDQVLKDYPNDNKKTIKSKAKEKISDINPSTFNTQFGKWWRWVQENT